jgi:hypothetical protein
MRDRPTQRKLTMEAYRTWQIIKARRDAVPNIRRRLRNRKFAQLMRLEHRTYARYVRRGYDLEYNCK